MSIDPVHRRTEAYEEVVAALHARRHCCVKPLSDDTPRILDGVQVLRALGVVVDQLHGELQEGDQVLEWNGVPLTAKTYEEVQAVISNPNGEIELVIRT